MRHKMQNYEKTDEKTNIFGIFLNETDSAKPQTVCFAEKKRIIPVMPLCVLLLFLSSLLACFLILEEGDELKDVLGDFEPPPGEETVRQKFLRLSLRLDTVLQSGYRSKEDVLVNSLRTADELLSNRSFGGSEFAECAEICRLKHAG